MAEEHKRPLSQEPEAPAPESAAPAEGQAPATSQPKEAKRPTLTPGQQKRRQKSVFQYITILFAAAFALLLFTFLMERRQNDLLQQQNQEEIDSLQQESVNAVQSLQNLYDQNESLKQQVADLEEQLADYQDQMDVLPGVIADLEQTLDSTQRAMDWFWQIDEAYVRSRWTLCRQLIDSLEEAGLVDYLPKESTTDNDRFSPYDRFQEIKEAVD
ncbi:hypothetical protein [Flavonifractor sp. An100]|uniref:hypothetical protein n=1 Tax=Flavonifractor sp. An100 TaxID=1965538 RepID=UPI000B382E61|nr:hypothetical protein [Flavonifractor sp. An100]OUQ76867.1 hypothetical protein B5E43_11000 [Flavonifractor sp. An100]